MVKRYAVKTYFRLVEDAGSDLVSYDNYRLLQSALKEALDGWDSWNRDQLEGSHGWIGSGGETDKRIAELRKQFLGI